MTDKPPIIDGTMLSDMGKDLNDIRDGVRAVRAFVSSTSQADPMKCEILARLMREATAILEWT